MLHVAAVLAALVAPPAPGPSCTPALVTVQGQDLYCCTMATGQQCCGGALDLQGKVLGCPCG